MQHRQIRRERLGDERVERLHDLICLPVGEPERRPDRRDDRLARDRRKQLVEEFRLLLLLLAGHRQIVCGQRRHRKGGTDIAEAALALAARGDLHTGCSQSHEVLKRLLRSAQPTLLPAVR